MSNTRVPQKMPGLSEEKFMNMKKSKYLKQISSIVILKNIPDSLILSLDQIGTKIIPTSEWPMAVGGSRGVEVAGLNDKQQVTATFKTSFSYQCRSSIRQISSEDKFLNVFHIPYHWAKEVMCPTEGFANYG